ncbi:MAG: lipopolysaccharide biosynthesis protein [Proteobacteria bacterium]|nr:lipopolysaccharide biosynthesis protein [Pseudomonadota bacterium]
MNDIKKQPEPCHGTSHLVGDVKGRSARGGVFIIAGQGLILICRLMGIFILARLLPPHQHGLVAMATAFTGFIYIFKDLGLSMATIQRQDINDAQISCLFWVNILLGLILTVLTATSSLFVAWFFGQSELIAITVVLSAIFVLSGLGAQHMALLRRQMRYGRLVIVESVAVFCGIAGAVFLALIGAEYWALVFQPLIIAIVTTVGAWYAYPWRPAWWIKNTPIRDLITFGGNIVGHDVLNYIFRNLDDILIGRIAGPTSLGYYNRAYQIATLPLKLINTPLSTVTLSGLSLLQNDPKAYRHYYLMSVHYIAFVTMPVIAMLTFLAPQIITLLLGDQWVEAGEFFRILSIGAFYQPVTNSTGWLFISSGRTREMLTWRIRTIFVPVIFFIAGAWVAGAKGVVWGHTLSVIILTIPCIWFAQRGTGIGTWSILKSTGIPMIASLGAAMMSWITYNHLRSLSLSMVIVIPVYLALCCMMARNFSPITNIYEIVNTYIIRKNK